MRFHELTPARAQEALAALGVVVAKEKITLHPRDGRWLAELPRDRAAWFARTEDGLVALVRERRVLRALHGRVSFAIPRVVVVDAAGDCEVRTWIAGTVAPFAMYARVLDDEGRARATGARLGAILAELHRALARTDLAFLPRAPSWPRPRADTIADVRTVVDDEDLVARADALLARAAALTTDDGDRVLVHADLGFHNLVVDDAHAVRGVVDFADAAYAHFALDFRYLLVGADAQPLFDAARDAYRAATGRVVDTERVAIHHAACAVSYLGFRKGHAPDEKWCGRTLDEDLAWTRRALARVT